MDELEEGLKILELHSAKTFSLLNKYTDEIELFNPAYGLVKVKNRSELIVRHILDSLAPVHTIRNLLNKYSLENQAFTPDAGLESNPGNRPNVRHIADLGSGAGLPGIPLGICMPDAEFTLVERMGRRAGFLRNTLALLGLPNVSVEEAEMEKIGVSHPGSFDLVLFRAFKPLDTVLLKSIFKLLKPGGIMAAYKGRKTSIDEEMAGLSKTPENGIVTWEAIPVKVPFLEEERHLLIMRESKIKKEK